MSPRRLQDRILRHCQHEYARHEHGTHAAYALDDCRCEPCSVAHTRYARDRNRRIAYGRWNGLVDAEPARQHVQTLGRAGLGWRRAAADAGVSTGTVNKLLYGRPKDAIPPSRRIHAITAQRILAVQIGTVTLAGGVCVDATGTRRRLQALVAIGWSQRKLADKLNMQHGNFARILRASRVLKSTADAVTELYGQLWDQTPPATTHHDRSALNRSRAAAASKGWAPPMAWNDDAIDDSAAQPEGVGLSREDRRAKLPPIEELQFLLEQGETKATIADRYSVPLDTVDSALSRAAHRTRENNQEAA